MNTSWQKSDVGKPGSSGNRQSPAMQPQPLAQFDVKQWMVRSGAPARAIHVSQPQQVTCWTKSSVTEGSNTLFGDTTGLLRYQQPKLPVDLNEGYPEAYTRKAGTMHPGVEPIVEAINQAGFAWEGCDVCTFRNNLNKLCRTPLDTRSPWVIDACMHGSTLFLDIQDTPQQQYKDADRFTYYGYKFEAECTGGGPTVDATSEFAVLVRLRVDHLRIVLAAEIDCYDAALVPQGLGTPGLASYIELKTSKLPQHAGQASSEMRHKWPKWWLQSWLAGVPRIAVGYRDEAGILRDVQVMKTQHLPSAAEKAGCGWNCWTVILFARDALSWMRDVAGARPGQHIRFTYAGRQQIDCSLVAGGDLPSRVAAAVKC